MILWQVSACCCALLSGALFSGIIQDTLARKRRRAHSRASVKFVSKKTAGNFTDTVLDLWERSSLEQKARNDPVLLFCRSLFARRCERWMQKQSSFLGRPGLTSQGLSTVRFVFSVVGLCIGLIVGYALGLPTVGFLVLCLLGAILASQLPFRVASSHVQRRKDAMERELPQMLAMVSLGLQSGLSFDRSFTLYAARFTTDFAQECLNAQRRWEMSLSTREEALRELGKSYDSPLFEQAVESMIRSLRLGTALAENLEALSAEARNQYRADCQQAIAKAPVKMMVPTGVLILPAMLILVMGPILLEMMGV